MVKDSISMKNSNVSNEVYEDVVDVNTKYDLIGTISKETKLTRKTIIEILSKMNQEVFTQYQHNPEEFIRKTCNFINIEKYAIIKECIT